ncbi:MAG: hypothetical protein ACOX6N_01235 [Patescibacteria group bacterium]
MREFDRIKRFAKSVDFFSDRDTVERVVDSISEKMGVPVRRLVEGKEELARYVVEGSSLSRELVLKNSALEQAIFSFLFGYNRLLVIGGDPGNGKSLLATDIRRFSQVFRAIDENLEFPLAFIPFDKVRETFFLRLSERLGYKVPLPKGTSPDWMMETVERVMASTTFFVLDNYPKSRVIVEAPLFSSRGENIIYEAEGRDYGIQTIIVHSPEMYLEIINRGSRDVDTSGQPEAMVQLRMRRLKSITGDANFDFDTENKILRGQWETMLRGRKSLIIEWSPNELREPFEETRKEFITQNQRPDLLTPLPLGPYIKSQFDLIFDLFGDKSLLKLVSRP